ncbi:MAG: Lrp/AsnC ligand binding domain-containing protein [Candidatus Odinarchaeia archaeon]
MLFIIFANIAPRREKEAYLAVAEKIPKFEGIKGVYITFGRKDVVIIYEGKELKDGVKMAVKLRNIPGITDTETIVCLDIKKVFTP